MNYRIETAPSFDRAAKRLAKKYRRLKRDLQALVGLLTENPWAGVAIPGFSHAVWKVRLASSDMQVGKRSGYRVIYIINQLDQVCYLWSWSSFGPDLSGAQVKQSGNPRELHLRT